MSMAMNVGVGLGVIVGFGALALDLGYTNFALTQTQAAADAAAIAGAISLQLDDNDDAAMVSEAQAWGQDNNAGTSAIVVDAADVRRGDLATGGNCIDFVDNAGGFDVYARAYTNDTPAFLSRIWGNGDSNTEACAVARVLPPSVCTMIGTGDAGVNGNSNLLIGYDSEIDPDPENSPNPDAAVCSNSDITLHGGPTIEGSVRPGIGAEIVGDTDNVSGTTEPLGERLDYPDPDFAAIAAEFSGVKKAWSPDRPYNIGKKQSLVLSTGAYELTGDLSITGMGTITLAGDGPVVLLTNGFNVTLTGGGVVLPEDADTHDFSIYAKGDSEIKIGGTSSFYGYIYAPKGPVTLLGTAAFYGAVVSDGLDIKGGGINPIYMDVSLMDDEEPGGIRLIR